MNKYNDIRLNIQTGDIVLWHGEGMMSNIINKTDKSYYNHIGIAVWIEDRLATLDMWNGGLVLVPMSLRAKSYTDICIIRPQFNLHTIEESVSKMLDMWETHFEYDYWTLLRIWVKKKTKIDLTFLGREDKFICSEFVQRYVYDLDISVCGLGIPPTPHDFLRVLSQDPYQDFKILFR